MSLEKRADKNLILFVIVLLAIPIGLFVFYRYIRFEHQPSRKVFRYEQEQTMRQHERSK